MASAKTRSKASINTLKVWKKIRKNVENSRKYVEKALKVRWKLEKIVLMIVVFFARSFMNFIMFLMLLINCAPNGKC